MSNIIFDFDGTIADSFEYVFRFLSGEARRQDISPADTEQYRFMSMKHIALKLGIPYWRLPLLYFKGRRVMRSHIMHIEPFDGMPEVIEELHAQGHTLTIISSNSARNVRNFLRQYKLDQYFTRVIGGAGYLGKVRPIRRLKKRYQHAAYWYVGDELTDIISAKAAGVQVIAVSWGFGSKDEMLPLEPDHIVDRPEQILDNFK